MGAEARPLGLLTCLWFLRLSGGLGYARLPSMGAAEGQRPTWTFSGSQIGSFSDPSAIYQGSLGKC